MGAFSSLSWKRDKEEKKSIVLRKKADFLPGMYLAIRPKKDFRQGIQKSFFYMPEAQVNFPICAKKGKQRISYSQGLPPHSHPFLSGEWHNWTWQPTAELLLLLLLQLVRQDSFGKGVVIRRSLSDYYAGKGRDMNMREKTECNPRLFKSSKLWIVRFRMINKLRMAKCEIITICVAQTRI